MSEGGRIKGNGKQQQQVLAAFTLLPRDRSYKKGSRILSLQMKVLVEVDGSTLNIACGHGNQASQPAYCCCSCSHSQ